MWLVQGKDPKIEAEKEKSQAILFAISNFDFQYFAKKKPFIRTEKQQQVWLSRLKKWASPIVVICP